ncbi:hypothetical protein HDU98_004070 [Podochytrium sp. JEL0797]|nr:hypothetical protein HDU98_004070 [Podochytrium sp. JEL0797]
MSAAAGQVTLEDRQRVRLAMFTLLKQTPMLSTQPDDQINSTALQIEQQLWSLANGNRAVYAEITKSKAAEIRAKGESSLATSVAGGTRVSNVQLMQSNQSTNSPNVTVQLNPQQNQMGTSMTSQQATQMLAQMQMIQNMQQKSPTVGGGLMGQSNMGDLNAFGVMGGGGGAGNPNFGSNFGQGGGGNTGNFNPSMGIQNANMIGAGGNGSGASSVNNTVLMNRWNAFNTARSLNGNPTVTFDQFVMALQAQQGLLQQQQQQQQQQQNILNAYMSLQQSNAGMPSNNNSNPLFNLNALNSMTNASPALRPAPQPLIAQTQPISSIVVAKLVDIILQSQQIIEPPLPHARICAIANIAADRVPVEYVGPVNEELGKRVRERKANAQAVLMMHMQQQHQGKPAVVVAANVPQRNPVSVSPEDLVYIKSLFEEMKDLHSQTEQLIDAFKNAGGKDNQIRVLTQIASRSIFQLQSNAGPGVVYTTRSQADSIKRSLTDLYLQAQNLPGGGVSRTPSLVTLSPAKLEPPSKQPGSASLRASPNPIHSVLTANPIPSLIASVPQPLSNPLMPPTSASATPLTPWPFPHLPLPQAMSAVTTVNNRIQSSPGNEASIVANADATLTGKGIPGGFIAFRQMVMVHAKQYQSQQLIQQQNRQMMPIVSQVPVVVQTQVPEVPRGPPPMAPHLPNAQVKHLPELPMKVEMNKILNELGRHGVWQMDGVYGAVMAPIAVGFNEDLQAKKGNVSGLAGVGVDEEFQNWDDSAEEHDISIMLGGDYVIPKWRFTSPFKDLGMKRDSAADTAPQPRISIEQEVGNIESKYGLKAEILEAGAVIVSFESASELDKSLNGKVIFTIRERSSYEQRIGSLDLQDGVDGKEEDELMEVETELEGVFLEFGKGNSRRMQDVIELLIHDGDIQLGEYCSLDINGLSQTSLQSPNFQCTSDVSNSATLQAQLSAALTQTAKSDIKASIPTAIMDASFDTNLNKTVNQITNNVNINNISACVQSNMSNQAMLMQRIKGGCPAVCSNPNPSSAAAALIANGACKMKVTDLIQNATNSAVASCLASDTAYSSNTNVVDVKTTQTAVLHFFVYVLVVW